MKTYSLARMWMESTTMMTTSRCRIWDLRAHLSLNIVYTLHVGGLLLEERKKNGWSL